MTRPTARGAALLAVAAGTYLAARFVGTWELYFLALALAVTVAVAYVQVRALRGRLKVTRTVTPRQPFAGDPLLLSCLIRTGSRAPGQQITLLHASGGLDADDPAIRVESMGSNERHAVTLGPWPARRGIHHLRAPVAIAEDQLGLVRDRNDMETLDVIVPPRLAHLGSCALFAASRSDEGAKRRLATFKGSEFRGIRPHSPGEPLNRVDWKATAKTGSLMLRETEDPTGGDITVVLNGAAADVCGKLPETNFELAVEAAGSITDYALRTGRAATLLVPEHGWRPLRLAPGANGHVRLLEALAATNPQVSPGSSASLRALVAGQRRLDRAHLLVLVVLALDEASVRELVALRRAGMRATVVHVPGDSFGSTTGPADDSGLRRVLLTAGVGYLALERGADLRAALSQPAEDRRVRVL